MSIADMGASHSILRMTAMNQRDPIHSFLFDRAGMLLDANAAAMHSCKSTAQASGVACCTACIWHNSYLIWTCAPL